MGPFLLTSSKSLKTLTLRHGSRGIVQNVTSTSKHRSGSARLTAGGFHKTAPYELHGSVSRLTLSDNAQHNSAAAML